MTRSLAELARKADWRARITIQRRADDLLERRHGVSSAERISLEDLGVPGRDRLWHHPSDWISVRRAISRLDPTPDDVFLDLGSGLGRALLIAAAFPFRRVIGVELAPGLCETARENVARFRGRRRCGAIDVVCEDALAYAIPPDVSIVYVYSSFTGELFSQVFERILGSVDENPRLLRLVYNYPVEHNHVLGSGRAVPLDVSPRSWPKRRDPDDVIVTYALLPHDDAARPPIPEPTVRLRRHSEWTRPYDAGFHFEKPASRTGAGG